MPSARVLGPASGNVGRGNPNDFARTLFTGLPRHYDFLEELLSFGQNRRWRNAMVGPILSARPSLVLDVATGTAGVALQIARATDATVVGIDLTEAMLGEARRRRQSDPAGDSVALLAGRAESLPFEDATFDALTFTYLLRYVADPGATMRELARVVKPGGRVASLEFAVPVAAFWRALWRCHTRVVLPVVGSLWGRAWWDVGRFLGPDIEAYYRRFPVTAAVDAWHGAGLVDVEHRVMSLGGGLVMSGRRGG